jgi:hypothetical protein
VNGLYGCIVLLFKVYLKLFEAIKFITLLFHRDYSSMSSPFINTAYNVFESFKRFGQRSKDIGVDNFSCTLSFV